MPAQVILAFANDTGDSLKQLQRENETVYGYLNKMDKKIVNAVQKFPVNLNNLFDEFAVKKADIRVFHFSGHAGQMDLLFQDGKRVAAEGIAALMAYASNVELVFLNGCGTGILIDAFHKAGVKVVIATSRKVFDEEAAEFSIKFYLSLSQMSTVGEAFEYAKAYATSDKQKTDGSERHIATSANEVTTDEFPYGIFYKPQLKEDNSINNNLKDYEKYDQWRFDLDETETPDLDYNPCIELLKCIGKKGIVLVKFLNENSPKRDDPKTVDEEVSQFSSLHRVYTAFLDRTQDIDHAQDLARTIIDLLPRPLGIIMRQMNATAIEISKKKNSYSELLKYQLHFYDVLVKISCFTMLSDLYEVLQKTKLDEKKKIPYFDAQTYQDILKLLSLQEKDVLDYNFRELIRNMRQKIIDNESRPFISEYMGPTDGGTDTNLEMAHEIIKFKKIQFNSNQIRGGWVNHCKAVEDELCNILNEVYFIMRYNLLVIRNVEAIRWRFSDTRQYDHRITLLRYSNNPERHILQNDFTENYSVILVKGLKTIVEFLSLMPFVIDKCVLDEGSSQLFYYSHWDNNTLIYEGVEDGRERIEIETCEREEESVDDNDQVVAVKVKYIPYAEVLAKDPKVDKVKVTSQLMEIFLQFKYFQDKMRELTYRIKK